jgi:hypothetical protein
MGRDTSVGGEGAGSEQCLGEEAPDGNWTIPFSTWRRFFFIKFCGPWIGYRSGVEMQKE